MNIKELAKQAGIGFNDGSDLHTTIKRFAELVRQDYANVFISNEERDENIRSEERRHLAEHYLAIMRDAVAQAVKREREACAKLCEDLDDDIVDGLAGWQFAEAIRARSK